MVDEEIRVLLEEAVRLGLLISDVLGGLLDELPEDAFPGEEPGEVLLEMVTGSIRPAAEAAGERAVREATALLGAIGERVVEDLRAAAARAAS